MSGVLNNQSGYLVTGVAALIQAGQTDSSPINVHGLSLVGLVVPAVLTGTAISFLVGDSEDGFQAQGQVSLNTNAADGDTLSINGVTLTFVDADPAANEILIGATKEDTAAALFEFLSETEDEDLLACTYDYIAASNVLMVTAVEYGTGGNAIAFAKSSTHITLSPSGGFLTGGGFRPLYNASNSLISMTVAAGRTYAVDPANFQGLRYLKFKSGTTEVATRTLFASVKGF